MTTDQPDPPDPPRMTPDQWARVEAALIGSVTPAVDDIIRKAAAAMDVTSKIDSKAILVAQLQQDLIDKLIRLVTGKLDIELPEAVVDFQGTYEPPDLQPLERTPESAGDESTSAKRALQPPGAALVWASTLLGVQAAVRDALEGESEDLIASVVLAITVVLLMMILDDKDGR